MSEDILSRLKVLLEIVAEPTSNLTASMLLLAALTVILLIVIVVASMFLVGSGRDDGLPGKTRAERRRAKKAARASRSTEAGEAPAGTKARRRPLRASTYVVFAVLVAVALVVGYVGTAQDQYCVTCHEGVAGEAGLSADESTDTALPETPHASVSCVACHEAGQITGVAANTIDRTRHLVKQLTGAPVPADAVVDSSACLRCHDDILEEAVETADTRIRMSHREPVEAGLVCTGCHDDVAHGQEAGVKAGMVTCLRCHDGEQATAECGTCHLADVGYSTIDKRVFTAVNLPPISDCGGCHDQEKCDACHGFRMPHPQDFLDGEHARYAGFDLKEKCYACHVRVDCDRCHATKDRSIGYWGHGIGPVWKYQHYDVPPGIDPGCGCHGRSRYVQEYGNYCKACH